MNISNDAWQPYHKASTTTEAEALLTKWRKVVDNYYQDFATYAECTTARKEWEKVVGEDHARNAEDEASRQPA